MSFSFKNVQGDASNIPLELDNVVNHDREDRISQVVVSAVENIVRNTGGYLSVDVRGHLNPAAGETGDEISIHIVSLPIPADFVPASSEPAEEFTPVEEITTGSMETVEVPTGEIAVTGVQSDILNKLASIEDTAREPENPVVEYSTPANPSKAFEGENSPVENISPEENQAQTPVEEQTVVQIPPVADDIPF